MFSLKKCEARCRRVHPHFVVVTDNHHVLQLDVLFVNNESNPSNLRSEAAKCRRNVAGEGATPIDLTPG